MAKVTAPAPFFTQKEVAGLRKDPPPDSNATVRASLVAVETRPVGDARVVALAVVHGGAFALIVRHAHLDRAGAALALPVRRLEEDLIDPAVARRLVRARTLGPHPSLRCA